MSSPLMRRSTSDDGWRGAVSLGRLYIICGCMNRVIRRVWIPEFSRRATSIEGPSSEGSLGSNTHARGSVVLQIPITVSFFMIDVCPYKPFAPDWKESPSRRPGRVTLTERHRVRRCWLSRQGTRYERNLRGKRVLSVRESTPD
jgi:hypothetical protein